MSRKAIVTIAIGEHGEEMAKITHPLMRAYAEYTGAEFIVIDKPFFLDRFGKHTYEKLNCYKLLEEYERIIFLDSDILISLGSPDLFEIVPESVFGASNEYFYPMRERDISLTQIELGPIEWEHPYFNAGMMVFSKAHKELFNPEDPDLQHWVFSDFRNNHVNLLNDQPYFNYKLNKIGYEFIDLGTKFNLTRAIRDTKIRFRAYFIHYAGPSGHRYGTRLEQMARDRDVLNSPALLWLSKKFPSYRWVADRVNKAFLVYLLNKLTAKLRLEVK